MIKVYESEHIVLSPVRCDDTAIEKYLKWVNDRSISRFTDNTARIFTYEAEKEWIKRTASISEEGRLNFNINNKTLNVVEDPLIGNCTLEKISFYGSYRIGILIGEEDGRNKGYGTEVITLLLKIAFNDLNAHRVELNLDSLNKRAFVCYSKCGFVEIGRSHETWYEDGKWSDTIHMEILRSQWEKLQQKQ